ncbi:MULTISPECIES: Xaa-Pro peptidase family protein [unclassified Bradyrhizobium]|uniref:M24 family metallopeptidase n=1 Tax=unclassified Bradyrhizobium TaxID=2631580 RepID=UPI00247895D8|nr:MULTISPECIES: Xaa-Pro peptidase family protein [unclassified Bradyrhizobium]WGR72902.1 Xaa-Pro peptidase family protein [Bradyrhizobium sp. ISRA426]WGR77737.1 Xaa-Pro peptidase family protein [Bradyrhizobium sp. ISRA430]WGR88142.1 Xaa-Pro peptidase family protein [Bradyrhizobium sp. ISRA432]
MDFPYAEYRARLQRTQEEMAKHNLPVLLLHQPENILYLTGFYTTGYFSYHALAVPSRGDPVLILRDMEVPAARSTSWVKCHTIYADAADPVPVWLEAARRAVDGLGLAGGHVGVDEHSWFLTVERWKMLQAFLPKATLVREPRIVDHLRLIKSPREIDYLRSAARQVEVGMRAGIEAIGPGVTERVVAGAVFNALVSAGSGLPLSGIITSGNRTDLLHGDYSDRRLEQGDTVYFELQGIYQKYWARLMRTAVVGEPTGEQRRIAETIIRIQDEAIALMRPGTSADVVDRACRKPLLASGLRETYTNRAGYSLGLNYRPSAGEFIREFVPGVEWVIEPGMVFHMLMMAAGMGFSETVLVTDQGPERLTGMERKLFSRL